MSTRFYPNDFPHVSRETEDGPAIVISIDLSSWHGMVERSFRNKESSL